MIYSSYLADGSFYQVFGGSEPVVEELGMAVGYVHGDYAADDHWFDFEGGNVARLKQPMGLLLVDVHIVADGEDFSIIHGVPAGVSVSVNGAEPELVTDGEVKFKTVDAGDHSLVFSGVPYLTEEVIVGAI